MPLKNKSKKRINCIQEGVSSLLVQPFSSGNTYQDKQCLSTKPKSKSTLSDKKRNK